MSEKGKGPIGQPDQAQGGKPPEQPGQPQGGKPQDYVVKTTFTDEQGRTWTAGSKFVGDEGAVRKALAAKQIEAKPAATPT